MAGTTTNNGWDYPTSTDLLKDGALAIQTLATDIDTSVGTGLLAWTSYTPTFANFTLGNGTISFAYSQVGKVVNVRGLITLGTTSTMGSNMTISTPVTAFTASGGPPVGQCVLSDTGVGAYPSLVTLSSTTTFLLYCSNTGGSYAVRNGLTSTIPFTWTSTDVIYIQATYQAA